MSTKTRKKGRFASSLSGAYVIERVAANKKASIPMKLTPKVSESWERTQENISKLVDSIGCRNECTTRTMTKEELLKFEEEMGLRR